MGKKNRKQINPTASLPTDSSGARPSRIHEPVTLSFKHCESGGRYCLSLCEEDEIRAAINCLQKLGELTWQQVLMQGGKIPYKTGLAHTQYPDDALRGVTKPFISKDIQIAGLRASQRMRVFGFYLSHIFFILWFDRSHEIVPG
jgi:hypothetical protein